MKMNKIMAAGIAATLAVTSLASVASAEVAREFEMKYSTGVWTYTGTIVSGAKSEQLGDEFGFVKPTDGTKANTFAIKTLAEAAADTNLDGAQDYQDFDAFIPLTVASANGVPASAMGDLTIEIKGRNYDNGNLVNITQKIKLLPVAQATLDGAVNAAVNYVLPIYAGGSAIGDFQPELFSAVDTIEIKAGSLKNIAIANMTKAEYKTIFDKRAADKQAGNKTYLQGNAGGHIATVYTQNWYDAINGWWEQLNTTDAAGTYTNDAALTIRLAAAAPTAANLVYQVTGAAGTVGKSSTLQITGTSIAYATATEPNVAPTTAAGKLCGAELIKEINTLLSGGLTAKWVADDEGIIGDNYAEMPVTIAHNYNTDPTIYRAEVKLLSRTNDVTSNNIWSAGDTDNDQTYTVEDYNKGTNAKGFAGLASQVADFFNHQTNGTISFHFVASSTSSSGFDWLSGGIPSTEVGLRNFLENANPKDFALFLNYETSTGSLQSDAIIDVYSGTVTFDISASLTALGGQTIGTIHDVYYALAKGIDYDKDGNYRLKVDKVILAYDEAAAADAATATDEEEKKEEVKEEPKADDKADEIEIADDTEEPDDEDSTVVIDEPDDSQTVIDNTADNTVVVNPGNNVAPAADENPHTGVALAVVPAALAAAAMIISKKRK